MYSERVLPPPDLSANSEYAALQCGFLERAGTYAASSDHAARMRAGAPVFTTVVDGEKFVQYAKLGPLSFRMGAIQVDDCTIMTARLQKGGAQFIWLADAADSDFWSAMNNMSRSRELGFVFQSTDKMWFLPWQAPTSAGALERYRRHVGQKGEAFVHVASSLIADGSIEKSAESAFAGVEVGYRCINILLTRRVKAAVKSVTGAVIVPATSAVAAGAASFAPASSSAQ